MTTRKPLTPEQKKVLVVKFVISLIQGVIDGVKDYIVNRRISDLEHRVNLLETERISAKYNEN